MIKKESIEGFAIDKMIAKHLDIDVDWIISVDIDADGVSVEYDDPNDEEE